MPTVDVIDERVKEFLANNPQVVRAMEAWAKTSAQYEEAIGQSLLMPVAYSGTSAVAAPALQPPQTRR
jgi:hypothetical protein